MKEKIGHLVLKALGLLLLTAAVLKGYELLTTPMANTNIWTNRYFLIFQVEFELALGIWLLSGLFKRAAWLVALACFMLFCGVTLYKGISGAASCGCFGKVHVNPWMTLFAIDFPAVIALVVFRPFRHSQQSTGQPCHSESRCIGMQNLLLVFQKLFTPFPPLLRLKTAVSIGLAILAVTGGALALNEPKTVTAQYEVLEPETWVGKPMPILEHIDIAEQLKTGNWLVMLYHHDCPDCRAAIPKLEQMAKDLQGNENFLRIALIEVPPYGTDNFDPANIIPPCVVGKLNASKDWFVTTPAMALIQDSKALQCWQENVPVLEELKKYSGKSKKLCNVWDKFSSK